jgi:hypothetical protein
MRHRPQKFAETRTTLRQLTHGARSHSRRGEVL